MHDRHACWHQRTTPGSWFCLYTTWVPGAQLKSSGLAAGTWLHPLNRLPRPELLIFSFDNVASAVESTCSWRHRVLREQEGHWDWGMSTDQEVGKKQGSSWEIRPSDGDTGKEHMSSVFCFSTGLLSLTLKLPISLLWRLKSKRSKCISQSSFRGLAV